EENQVNVFLSGIGPQAYGLLKNLIAPDKPKDKPHLQLAQILTGHHEPKSLIIAERGSKDSETVADYIVALKQFSTNCEFGAFLNEALRGRFVCGLKSESMQIKLLSEKDLTFQSASEIALAMELASKSSQELARKVVFQPCGVNKVWGSAKPAAETKQSPGPHTEKGGMYKVIQGGKNASMGSQKSCYRCGVVGGIHLASANIKNEKCHHCFKIGHIACSC
uniref:CCHC-type domain-containing protein n=1 Tax=Latimeria chalumnae TaxID=7897 RepID=H3AEX9_LATCH